MNTLIPSKPWSLHVFPPNYPKHLLVFAANIAQCSNLHVLDCGRTLDATIVGRAAKGHKEIVDQIHIQRAFNCYEVTQLIQRTTARQTPIFIFDPLTTFYDENVKLGMRHFLLSNILRNIQRLSRSVNVAVSTHLLPAHHPAFVLFQRLRASAPRVVNYETPTLPDKHEQLRLI